MGKHTEGPWNLENVGTGWTIGPREMVARDYVADVHAHVPGPGSMPDHESEANARLIAAAPELLEALSEALDLFAGDAERLDREARHNAAANVRAFERRARAAIAKAEGK